ncbi:MAG: hypothetical protein R3C02_11145 [Planctomycetaceae bacterium]
MSSAESIFHEIEQLVQSVDNAACEARRTVRVVSPENTNASAVQNTLSSLIPCNCLVDRKCCEDILNDVWRSNTSVAKHRRRHKPMISNVVSSSSDNFVRGEATGAMVEVDSKVFDREVTIRVPDGDASDEIEETGNDGDWRTLTAAWLD